MGRAEQLTISRPEHEAADAAYISERAADGHVAGERAIGECVIGEHAIGEHAIGERTVEVLAAEVRVGDERTMAGRAIGARCPQGSEAELAAKRSLKAQIARLERELSSLVVNGFPHIPLVPLGEHAGGGPRLLGLEQLESQRDALVARLREAETATAVRVEHERRARELLAAMQLEPGRYKFTRLRVADLGEGGCGVWEVRPRLGLVGMLAGWWELKLSSGCPLAKGRA
ncbi:MAG TPA: hypothetical protein VGF95_13885 [Solirubrobacteraceae bacterium]|jgi:hypothetical protein